ncbi:alpha/beta fold hydrolase [Ligilactobacillus ceti]|uniref:Serine aminopeptidase S33 domain-containing protein n=1 Tax=Ligilactobacillus ceti DSM 22408 TaxID=1122146 RepID=A0A0R2KHE7_9LACO|nr:alpha/beta fold hydrolase [Ligilactobacillus ceti]KRN88802.1 hypothetical protein IV53_GL000771 [Ligilactobacillus ceti DSM 22408]
MATILLHGLGQTAASWKQTLQHITQEDVVCLELKDLIQDQTLNYQNLYQSFEDYCQTYDEPLNLCGLSLGGILALNYALNHPTKTQSLILIGIQYKTPQKLIKLQNKIMKFLPERVFGSASFSKKEFLSLSQSMLEIDFTQDLTTITCPTLVICGEKDHWNKKAAITLNDQLVHAKLNIMPNAGHEINRDNPSELGQVMQEFLAKNNLSKR